MDEKRLVAELDQLLDLIDQLAGQANISLKSALADLSTDQAARNEESMLVLATIRARVKRIYQVLYPTPEARLEWILEPLGSLDPNALPRVIRQLLKSDILKPAGVCLQRLSLFTKEDPHAQK